MLVIVHTKFTEMHVVSDLKEVLLVERKKRREKEGSCQAGWLGRGQ